MAQLAIIRQMSGRVSPGQAGDYQADDDSLLLGHQKSPHLVPDILLNALHALSHLIFYTT